LGSTGITVNGGTSLVQNLTGSSITYASGVTVNVGTLNLSPSAASSMGALANSMNVGNANNNNGTVIIGPNATVAMNNLNMGQGAFTANTTNGRFGGNAPIANPGGNGTVTSSGIVTLNGGVTMGNVGLGNATLNITGGTFTVPGTVSMEINGGANQLNRNGNDGTGTIHPQSDFETGYTGGTINVSNNAKLYLLNTAATAQTIQMGQFFNPDATINQNGGTVAFITDANTLAPNALGQLVFQQNNSLNMGTYTYNLNGGVFQVGRIAVNLTADSNGGNLTLNNRPTINFNGGTLKAAGSQATFFNRNIGAFNTTIPGAGAAEPILTIVKAGGGTIDTAGFAVTMDAAFAHDPNLGGSDGGLNINDSGSTPGTLTMTGAGGTVSSTILTRGNLVAGVDQIATQSSVAATGTTSNQVVVVPTSTALSVGEAVSGPGIPAGTVIAAFNSTGVVPFANGSQPGAIRFGNITLGGPAAGFINVVLSNPTTIANAQAATLVFGATSPLGAELTMNGGNFQSLGVTRNLSAATKLKVTANSTIDLGSAGTLSFADSSLAHWANNAVVTINNPTGAHIFAGNSQTLNYNQLLNVTFAGSAPGATQLPTGELVPGTPTGTFEKLGDVNHNGTTNASDIGALATALSNVDLYTNNLTLDSGWSSKAAEALYLADVKNDDRINNLDMQGLLVYLANGGNGSNAPGGGSLTAVPEPSTWVLLAIGGLMLGGAGRRSQRRMTGR